MKKILAIFLGIVMVLSVGLLYLDDCIEVKAAETTATSKTVLDVKVQVSADGTVMRFISSVDSLNYSQVGFKVSANGQEKTYETNVVYERIASTTDSVKYEFGPKVVDVDSEYFITAKMNVTAGTDYTVRAFTVSADGQTVTYGMSRCVAVEDADGSTPLNLSFASTTTVAAGTELDVLYVYEGETIDTKATVIASDGNTVHTRVTVNKNVLPSATLFTFSGAASGSAVYRNLYTTYTGDGTEDTTWYDVYNGLGETEFVIATTADMYGFAGVVEEKEQLLDKTVYLAADMKLNEGRPVYLSDNSVEWKDSDTDPYNWNPIGTNMTTPFQGTFDGEGFTIQGLYCIDDSSVAGLFEYADYNSTICDFTMVDSYIYALGGWAGSVAGKGEGMITDIHSSAIVRTNATSHNKAGGIVGEYYVKSEAPSISRCWFDGAVLSAKYYNGGIIGWVASSYANATLTVEDCAVSGVIKGYSHTGGIIGLSAKEGQHTTFTINLERCLSTGTYTTSTNGTCSTLIGGFQNGIVNMATSYSSADCGTYFKQLYNEAASSSDVDTEKTASTNYLQRDSLIGSKASTNGVVGINDADSVWKITSGVPELKQFSESEFDIEWYTADPDASEFVISTADELYGVAFISRSTDFAGKTIKLANDIVLNEGDADEWKNGHILGLKRWQEIGSNSAATQFKGIFDGQGHTLSGLYGNYADICRGFIATVGVGGEVKNLRMTNSYVESTVGYLGSIVGRSDGGKFTQVYSDAYVVGNGVWNSGNPMYIGGIAGTAITTGDGVDDVLFKECWYNGVLESKSMRNGGIVGGINISTGTTDVTYLEDCLFTGSVWSSNGRHANGYGTAGMVGAMTTSHPITFKNCIATDDVVCTSNQFAGALYGASNSYTTTNTTFDNCYVIGSDVVPFSMGVHSAFTGSYTGEAMVVETLSEAAAIAETSSAWTLVGGVPVLTAFRDITP